MASWDDQVTFALDVEMVNGVVNGESQNLAGRVVLVRNDPYVEWIKVIDAYIKYPDGVVRDCLTRYSRIKPWQLQMLGMPRDAVVNFILSAIYGHTLVTFSGHHDLRSLGIEMDVVKRCVSQHIELQDFFKRPNGTPYGLGPLVDYFGYTRNDRKVVIRHNCVDDSVYTLRLYRDYYQANTTFQPVTYVLSKREYCTKYGIS